MGLVLWGSVELLSLAGIVPAPIHKSAPEGGSLTGMIVKMDKAKHEITLKHWVPGTIASATNSPTDLYRLEYDPAFDFLKAGDQVALTAERIGGSWTITHIQKE